MAFMGTTDEAGAVTAEDTDQSGKLRVEITGLRKEFRRTGGELVVAVDDVDLGVHPGEIVVLLGPSGCGKSTLLRCIAGLETPVAGRIALGGKVVYSGDDQTMVPPNERDVNMMFQSYALWPHMTLEDNVAYPLRIAGVRRRAARSRANEYLAMVGLHGLGPQYPGNISGGQQQRVALARTLISEPAVVLFDEPLSNVDAKVRGQLRSELLRLHRDLGFAAVYVTHDQIEAMGLGTRIAIMRDGRIEQLADPVTIYEHPATRYTAEFVGAANVWVAEVLRLDGTAITTRTAMGEVVVPVAAVLARGVEAPKVGAEITLMTRPEYCRIIPLNEEQTAPPPVSTVNSWVATVDTTLYAGSRTEYECIVDGQPLLVWDMASSDPIAAGSLAHVTISPERIRVVEVGANR